MNHTFRNALISTAIVVIPTGFALGDASQASGGATRVVDPGVRTGLANTGGGYQYRGLPIPAPPVIGPHPISGATINKNELASFQEGINRAGQLESTCDTCADVTDGSPVMGLGELDPRFPQFHTNSNGLGARHNGDQCMLCHAHPVLGGSGGFIVPNPGLGSLQPPENPQFRLIPNRFGKQNVVPRFEEQFGPIREVRFRFRPDGQRDGGVHQLWTVRGIYTDRSVANCQITQPDFATEYANGNLAFRIPLQMFGLGLIESIPDREILNHFNATASDRARFGIAGHPNRSGNDGTITRFGWKAQNKSLVVFAGEAYNVEMGITNEVFPQPTEEDPNCNGAGKPAPNDVLRTSNTDAGNQAFNNPVHMLADWMQFTMLMRFMDAPQPDPRPSSSAVRGKQLFSAIGCALCHTPQMQTAPAMNSRVLENRPVNLYSDLMLHRMGAGLADNILQGAAGPDEFRTQPLWGVGQRIFFLHDGRTSNMVEAIQAHFSSAAPASAQQMPALPPSEANTTVNQFNRLSTSDQQSVVDFLRSL